MPMHCTHEHASFSSGAAASGSSHTEDSLCDLGARAKSVASRLGMSMADVRHCQEAFEKADVDGSGTIDATELGSLLEDLTGRPLTQSDMQSLGQRFSSQSGVLDFASFLQAYASTSHYQQGNVDAMMRSICNTSRKLMEEHHTTPEEKIKVGGVQIKNIKRYVAEELEQMGACLALPWVVVLFFSFAISVTLHFRIDVLHAQRKALVFDLEENANFAFGEAIPFENPRMGHKNLYDMNTFADFWSWLNLGFVPLFWDEGWTMSEARSNIRVRCAGLRQALEEHYASGLRIDGAPSDAAFNRSCPEEEFMPSFTESWYGQVRSPKYLWFNTVIGGLRLRQERAEATDCPGGPHSNSVHTGMCIKPHRIWLKPDGPSAIPTDESSTNKAGGEDVILLSGMPQAEIRSKLRELENSAWINPMTRKAELLVTTFNAHIDLLLVTHIVVHVSSSGHFFRSIYPNGFWLNPYHDNWLCYVADVAWMACVLKILLGDVWDICGDMHRLGVSNGLWKASNLATCIDLASSVAALGIFAGWIVYLQEVNILTDFLERGEIGVPGTWSSNDVRDEFFNHVHHMSEMHLWRSAAITAYPFIMISRVFKVCAGQPRLALVTKTIQRAWLDIIHFGLVFISVFLLFAISAHIMWGPEFEHFATPLRAVDSTFHVLLGDIDWTDMRNANRAPAAIWFWAYVWLMDLVMLNMLLAIVMDIYTETRGNLKPNAETLWSQGLEVWMRWRDVRAGNQLSFAHILHCLEKAELRMTGGVRHSRMHVAAVEEEPVLNLVQLLREIPGLPEHQALRILTETIQMEENLNHESQTLAESVIDVQKLSKQMIEAQKAIGSVLHMADLNAALLKNTFSERARRQCGIPEDSGKAPLNPVDSDKQQALLQEQLLRSVQEGFQMLDARFASVEARLGNLENKVLFARQEYFERDEDSFGQAAAVSRV